MTEFGSALRNIVLTMIICTILEIGLGIIAYKLGILSVYLITFLGAFFIMIVVFLKMDLDVRKKLSNKDDYKIK